MITKHRLDTRAKALIKEYSNRGFNYQTVVRLKNREQYNQATAEFAEFSQTFTRVLIKEYN